MTEQEKAQHERIMKYLRAIPDFRIEVLCTQLPVLVVVLYHAYAAHITAIFTLNVINVNLL